MNDYYITFGSEGQPFKGGWIIIEAETIEQAARFSERYINTRKLAIHY